MRYLIDIIENVNPNVISVFHGTMKSQHYVHSGIFFSSQRDFSSTYGTVSEYKLDLARFVYSSDKNVIEEFFPLYSSYTDEDVFTWDEYINASGNLTDTWEIVEPVARSIVEHHGADGIVIYEGGIENYLVFNTSCIKNNDKI